MGFFHHKEPLKPNLLPYISKNYIIFEDLCLISSFKNLYPLQKQENIRKLEIFEKKKVSVSEKKVSAPIPIPKLDLGFGCTLVYSMFLKI